MRAITESAGEGESSEAVTAYYQRVKEELAALPGVNGVAVASAPPLFGWRGNNGVLPEGWDDPATAPIAERRLVSSDYFDVVGIRLAEGRGLQPSDEAEGARDVVVVSQGLADLAWPGESAIGKTLQHWSYEAAVVGVAENVRDEEIQSVTELSYYAPGRRVASLQGPFVIRMTGDPGSQLPAIRSRIWSVDPDVPITRMAPMTDLMAADAAAERYRARLMAAFSILAGLFALMGIYGVTSRSVARRTQEIGIRVALGAATAQVHRMVTLQALRLATAGVVLGVIGAVAIGGVLDRFLWGVSRTDPATLVLVGLGLLMAAAASALPPARRATRVDPLTALKTD